MPLFVRTADTLKAVAQKKFLSEKSLQGLIEKNLEAVFRCRFVASEYSTGTGHGGRIDTLALSEDDNPVIIEYKATVSPDLLTQSLFYLQWLKDRRADFTQVARTVLGPKTKVSWETIRVICLAPDYRPYDLQAVKVMGTSIELWRYRLFENDVLHLEDVFRRSVALTLESHGDKNPVMVEAGRKAAITRKTGVYSVDEHLGKASPETRQMAVAAHDFIAGLDPSIEVAPKQNYIAFKTSQNIVCMDLRKSKFFLYLKLSPKSVKLPAIGRDVTSIGHFGTGDLELTIVTTADFEIAKPLIQLAYEKVGG